MDVFPLATDFDGEALPPQPYSTWSVMGIDCLVDENLKSWLLECNLSPSLEVCAGDVLDYENPEQGSVPGNRSSCGR